MRKCARVGCGQPVKKPTNKYCSRGCCALDPARIETLRAGSMRRLLPLARQLELPVVGSTERALEMVCRGREDEPAGLSRLAV
ncbi:MAG: hypothetical protein ACYDGR_09665 [Candidatus Dormibacteria bacterium]